MFGLYIHIPYCRSKCRYCDFYSTPCPDGVPEAYIDALCREMDRFSPCGSTPLRPDTLYFGGGTPSLLTPAQAARLIRAAGPVPGAEITLEANPETVTPERLAAFRRAGVVLHHSQGFTPHAYVSMLLPLSVGMESVCELMEYELDGELAVTPEALNAVLPEGVRVLEVYESARKARELRRLRALLTLEYDGAVPEPAAITTLLERPELMVEKRTKRGMAETDIRPMLHAYHVEAAPGALLLTCEVSAQEPSLNPMLLAAAIERYLPEAKPDFVRCRRLEMLDEQGEVFR